LPAFIENEPTRILVSYVAMAAYHLSRYVRATQQAAGEGARRWASRASSPSWRRWFYGGCLDSHRSSHTTWRGRA